MEPTEQLQTLRQGELSPEDLRACTALLEEGGAVNISSAKTELPLASVVALKRIDGRIVGLGAIKRQRPQYATSKAVSSGYEFDSNMHELGYIAVSMAFGNRGFSRQIVAALLSAIPPQPVWATTSNQFMERTLKKAEFEPRGHAWTGNSGGTLRLWIRNPTSTQGV